MNVYLPDDLTGRARSAGVNVSAVADAIRALANIEADAWLDRLERLPSSDLRHEVVMSSPWTKLATISVPEALVVDASAFGRS